MFQERICYKQSEDGTYWGHFVNHPITISGEDLEDLKQSAHIMFEAYLNALKETFSQPEPFEFKEDAPEETTTRP